jgi:quinohemoprotein ethanol dehydrogenase
MLSLNGRRAALSALFLSFLLCRIALPVVTQQQPSAPYGAIDDARLAQSQKEPQNWPIYNGGWYEHRYSFLDQINVGNVSRLKPAWFVEFDTTRGQESTPLVVDGVMYVSTAWSKVYCARREDRQCDMAIRSEGAWQYGSECVLRRRQSRSSGLQR